MNQRTISLALLFSALLASCSAPGEGDGDGDEANGDFELPLDYVRSTHAQSLVLELDAAPGLEAREAARDYAADRLGAVIDKPGGVRWVSDGELPASDDGVWTFEELRELADTHRDLAIEEDAVKIHVLYVDGRYEDADVLGVAWANRHLAMFPQRLDEVCDGFLIGEPLCRVAESSVLLHELGHVVGLVDNGIPMVDDHRDEEHGAHDHNDECVMYWAYEGVGVLDVLVDRLTGTTAALDFDQACIDDLQAVQ